MQLTKPRPKFSGRLWGPLSLPVLWEAEDTSSGLERPEHEADHSLPWSANDNNVPSFTSNPPHKFRLTLFRLSPFICLGSWNHCN